MNRRRRSRLINQNPSPRRSPRGVASSAPADPTQLAQAAPGGSGAATTSSKLNYRGDRRNFDPNLIVGPDLFGAVYQPVSATYDADSDRTTIYFRSMSRAAARPQTSSR